MSYFEVMGLTTHFCVRSISPEPIARFSLHSKAKLLFHFDGERFSLEHWLLMECSITLVSIKVYQFQIEPRHEISNNLVCATIKASGQSAHTPSLIRSITSRLNSLCMLSYSLNIIAVSTTKGSLSRLL